MPDHDTSNPLGNQLLMSWAKLIYWYGIPAGLCVFLVYANVNGQEAENRAMREEHQRILSKLDEASFYNRQICINTSKTEWERAGCIPPKNAR